jgi:hypothetical protein
MKTPIVYALDDRLSLQPDRPSTAITTSVDAVQSTKSARIRRAQDAVSGTGAAAGEVTRSG